MTDAAAETGSMPTLLEPGERPRHPAISARDWAGRVHRSDDDSTTAFAERDPLLR